MKGVTKLAMCSIVCLAVSFGVVASSAVASFGVYDFSTTYTPAGQSELYAGSHPDITTVVEFNRQPNGRMDGTVRDIEVDMPAGFFGNPDIMQKCKYEELLTNEGYCDPEAQVGALVYEPSPDERPTTYPVYAMDTPNEQTAVLGVVALSVPARIVVSARTDDDFGLTAKLANANEGLTLARTALTLWGVPASSEHDPQRYCGYGCTGEPSTSPERPFLSMPTRCEPIGTEVRADSWQNPGVWVSASDVRPALAGCESLEFAPSLMARPTTNVADSPSGLDAELDLPQNVDDPLQPATAQLREAAVSLPPGLVINPSAANGLSSCDVQQIGFLGTSNERQRIRYEMPTTGSFTVTFAGQSTASVSATASAAEVAAAIESLPGLTGNVAVAGSPGSWNITFVGALAGRDIPPLSGTATDNPGQIIDVTGEDGGFNILAGGGSTAGTMKANFFAGVQFLQFLNPSRRPNVGELIEGPGIAPGTMIEIVNGEYLNLDTPTTEELSGAQLKTQLKPGLSAQELLAALRSVPAIGRNVLVNPIGTSGITSSFETLFVGDLAGTEPTLTAVSSLTGPGAGVVFAAKAPDTHPLEVSVVAASGTPRFSKAPATCPDAAKIGSVEIDTQVFPDPLKGSVYTMTPYQNPFGTLLGIYVVVEGRGLVIKLPGKVIADPRTGQLAATFDNNPQLPFEDFRLKFDGGAFGVLRTPTTCGTYATTSSLTPWSYPATPIVNDKDTYAILKGANNQACASSEAQLPNKPAFEAGSVSPLAGRYKPFVVNLRREDGSQNFAAVTLSPPPGLVAKLKGTVICSDAALAAAAAKSGNSEKASPSCPATSEVGNVYASAGAGPAPYNAPGKVYLAGPYKGTPLSLATVIPATAGPFDLGTVVTRVAVQIDPLTAQVTAKSDPLPQILQGIPLDVRSVSLRLDKPEFSLNPTSCDPSSVSGTLLSTIGAGAALDSRFQLAECSRLKFKPSLSFSLKGGTKRAKYPALTAVLKPRPGDANIASVSVALPHSEFLAQNHIKTICTRVQFAADACPKGSIYGRVSVVTPILDQPLTGPVYLRSSSNPLPDLVVDLHGPAAQPIRFESSGHIDSVNGGIRNTFEFVPDVPFTKLTLQLRGAKKGLLENSRDICRTTNKAAVSYTAHNGASYAIAPQLKAKGCGSKARKGHGKKGSGH